MILVDTSVLIDTITGTQSDKVNLFLSAIKADILFGISEYTYLETLQGARNSKEYNQLNEYLLNMHIYLLPKTIKTYDVAAQLYFNLRRQGITPRSTIDVLIALTAMEYDLFLLHDDKDFDMMAAKMPSLKVYE